jgi:hypothetical protein
MTLQDILRERSREFLDAIQNTKIQLEKLRGERQAALDRARQSRADADAKRVTANDHANSVRVIEAQVVELERQIQELRSRLNARQAELKRSRDQQLAISSAISEQRKRERSELGAADNFDEEIEKTEKALDRDHSRLLEARRSALPAYLDYVWGRLLEHSRGSEQRRAAVDTRQRFEQERHQTPELASLWEAREEWKRIVNSTAPTLVIQTARSELARVERELETRFPGLWDALAGESAVTETEELFFRTVDATSSTSIPLPIPNETWKAIADGQAGNEEQLAMRLVWALAKAMPPSESESQLDPDGPHPSFVTKKSADEVELMDPLVLELPRGGRVSLILSPLPAEAHEAFANENSNN